MYFNATYETLIQDSNTSSKPQTTSTTVSAVRRISNIPSQ